MGDRIDNHARPGRRAVLGGLGTAGAALALAGCGQAAPATSPAGEVAPDNNAAPGNNAAAGNKAATGIAHTSDVPVGGGRVFAEHGVVVTQPTAGQFKAFDATCTHAGCQVSQVADGMIHCPCHGSRFSIMDGSVRRGPARQALGTRTVTVADDSLSVT